MSTQKNEAWPWAENKTENSQSERLPILYPAGTYKIELAGRGSDKGFSKITKTQYDFWKDRVNDLGDALNEDYDYEENDVPKKARFNYNYYEYTDVGFYSGPDTDCWIEIKDQSNAIILMEKLTSYLTGIHGDDEYYEHFVGENEFYINYDCKPGYYLYWIQGGKGVYFESQLDIPEGEFFDPRNLFFYYDEVEGEELITKVKYKEQELDNFGGSWSGKYADYGVVKVDKK